MIEKIKDSLIARKNTLFAKSYLRYLRGKNHLFLKYIPSQGNLQCDEHDYFEQACKKIDQLKSSIDRDYCYLDIPGYGNIGDHMIYKGSLDFLNTLPYNESYRAALTNFNYKKIEKDSIILLQGGGNFGDLWPVHQQFREQVITKFKSNKIIILPQSIYFQKPENLKKAVDAFGAHPNLTICTRDMVSYKTAKKNFINNEILLLPDMASYMQFELVKNTSRTVKRVLLLQRKDKELDTSLDVPSIRNLDINDWPTYDHNYYNYLTKKHTQYDFYIDTGILFMAKYDLIITTRLHGSILAHHLGIPTILLDNIYGKNKNYYEAWMKDEPNYFFAENSEHLNKIILTYFPNILE